MDYRLKSFIEQNFDFYELQKIGFWYRGTKKNDYEAQANRICEFFDQISIYQYQPTVFPEPEVKFGTLQVFSAN